MLRLHRPTQSLSLDKPIRLAATRIRTWCSRMRPPWHPMAGAFNMATNEVWMVDSGNHRALVFPQQGGFYTSGSVVLGQNSFSFNSPNLIEGREVFFSAGGMVVDKNSNPPHLYIADT